jgi:hypothetical protein
MKRLAPCTQTKQEHWQRAAKEKTKHTKDQAIRITKDQAIRIISST